MRVTRTAALAFTAAFESEEELRHEYETNLVMRALQLPTSESVALNTTLLLTLQGPSGTEAFVKARAVAAFPGSIALEIDGVPAAILEKLKPATPQETQSTSDDRLQPSDEQPPQTAWDRFRALSQVEKVLLAIKADRAERALLLQDNDPRVLLSLLRNPRLTVDEVARLAKSSVLTYQIADVIMKSGQWMGSLDVRLALIHNAKTPPAAALRILPTLPDSEVRAIARGGTNMALKQAAVKKLQEKR